MPRHNEMICMWQPESSAYFAATPIRSARSRQASLNTVRNGLPS